MSDVVEQQQESVKTPAAPAVNDEVSPHDVVYTQSADTHADKLQTAPDALASEKCACTENVTASLKAVPARCSVVKSGRAAQAAKRKTIVSNQRGARAASSVDTDNAKLSLSASTDKEMAIKDVLPAGSTKKQRAACVKKTAPVPENVSSDACKSRGGGIEESSYLPIINKGDTLSSSDKVLAESLRHGAHVARLAGALFDQLQELHGLDEDWRRRLIEAARLHDIGFVSGAKGHHKASMKRINDDMAIELSAEDRPLVAQLARYHRKAWPSRRHSPFAALPRDSRKALRRAAALLRIADGLDYTHQSLVTEIHVKKKQRSVVLILKSKAECHEEMQRALRKGDLFEHLFKRQVECECQPD